MKKFFITLISIILLVVASLSAFYVVKKYEVTFDSDGGSTVATQEVRYNNHIIEPAEPTKDGFDFEGWYYNNSLWNFEKEYVTKDLTLKAKWKLIKYLITFDPANGNDTFLQEVKYNEKLTVPSNPKKDGYTFIGWTYNDVIWDFNDAPTEDMTLVAKYQEKDKPLNKYDVTINIDGVIDSNRYEEGTIINKPDTPAKEGYSFDGWYINDKLWESDTFIVNEELNIEARFKVNQYTITFDTAGGNEIPAITLDYNSKIEKPANPIKEGYKFVGWDKQIPDKMPSYNLTITAKWEIGTVKITFDTDGGSQIDAIVGEYGEVVNKPANPTRTGYTFTGWDKEIPSKMPSSDLTIKALWKINKYTITFNTNGGSSVKSITQDYDTSVTKPVNPTRSGYTFIGWDKEIPAKMPAKNITITAKWQKVTETFTVTFKDYDGKVLSTQSVEKGKSATAPKNPSRSGYTFTGWDKAFNNITSNLTVTALYEEIVVSKEHNVIYNLNGGVWGYKSKDEYVLAFLEDFYDFVRPSESKSDFIHGKGNTTGVMGSWKEYIGGTVGTVNKLLYNNDLTANHEGYFFNCTLYKAKWANLGEWVKGQNDRFAGKDYTYGALDFYRYIINDPDKYINIYGETFYKWPTLNEPTLLKFTYPNKAITLPTPLSKRFSGWYLNSDFSGKQVTEIPANTNKDFEVYAKWDDVKTYEVSFITNNGTTLPKVTVEYGETILLKDLTKSGYNFLGWYLNGKKVDNPFKFIYTTAITLEAKFEKITYSLVDLKYDGNPVKYRNSSRTVQIPNVYQQPQEQLRTAWVSSLVDDFTPSPNEATMKSRLLSVLDTFEAYNMNCIIFHIRTMNNAFYRTKMAPIPSNYGTYESFGTWDYLTWFISECHKRGMEFHAWMNPYRIKSYGYSKSATPADVAKDFKDYPLNAASNPDNILMTYRSDGTQGAILNPCKPAVQQYIVDTCIEVMEKYDVDAIHFDDYFYAEMAPSGDVLNQPDQKDYVSYINAHPGKGYNSNSSSDKKQWRRDNVDSFIYKLSTAMRSFNAKNNREVQLGIAPTGIYRNGNGSVNSGSNTGGQEHYSSYLFCDTLKWVKNEWIDYICPQSYWAFTHRTAGYADVMDWWNEAVEGTRVNLYSGIGLYMAEPDTNYSWGRQPYEVSNQILYTTKLKNVKGVSFFCYKNIKNWGNNSSAVSYPGLKRIQNEYWTTKVPAPKTMASR